jgi:hypothetical protein
MIILRIFHDWVGTFRHSSLSITFAKYTDSLLRYGWRGLRPHLPPKLNRRSRSSRIQLSEQFIKTHFKRIQKSLSPKDVIDNIHFLFDLCQRSTHVYGHGHERVVITGQMHSKIILTQNELAYMWGSRLYRKSPPHSLHMKYSRWMIADGRCTQVTAQNWPALNSAPITASHPYRHADADVAVSCTRTARPETTCLSMSPHRNCAMIRLHMCDDSTRSTSPAHTHCNPHVCVHKYD